MESRLRKSVRVIRPCTYDEKAFYLFLKTFYQEPLRSSNANSLYKFISDYNIIIEL